MTNSRHRTNARKFGLAPEQYAEMRMKARNNLDRRMNARNNFDRRMNPRVNFDRRMKQGHR